MKFVGGRASITEVVRYNAWRRAWLLAAATLAGITARPAVANAHGLVGKQDLPIPRWLFAWAAALVLVLSFVALAALWPAARWQSTPTRRLWRLPRLLTPVCGAVGIAVFVTGVVAGLVGTQEDPSRNLLPTLVYVVFWVIVPLLSCIVGDVFRAFNPWLAIGRAAGWAGRRLGGSAPDPVPYPAWLGYWPAVVGLVIFGWVELAYGGRDAPFTIAWMALAYTAVQFIGMGLFGTAAWSHRGDAFGVYFAMFARLSPLRWSRRELLIARPLSGVSDLPRRAATVALVCTAIGITTFDGLTLGDWWNSFVPAAQDDLVGVGLSLGASIEAISTVGLLLSIVAVSAFYRLGMEGVRSAGAKASAGELAGVFAHSLIPVALAYVAAHYVGLVAYQGQAMAYLISDPLGTGSDFFGTADATVDYRWISASAVWYLQVVVLLVGHVGGLLLAHDRALALFGGETRRAVRSQYWLLVVMVGFTTLALFLLSAS